MRQNETLRVEPAPGVQVEWLPMESAPKDGTLVRLLVEFEHHATEDGEGPQPTIGTNTADNTGEDIGWQFAGWNWGHDCYTQGVGKPVGWLPMLAAAPKAQPKAPTVARKCAQCKKVYKQGPSTPGCPKCAPGAVVSEHEFQKPINPQAATPAAPAPGASNSADELARDLKKAIDTATELREQLRLMEEHAKNEVWRWQADGADELASMGNRMGILIYACDLRALLTRLASPANYVNSAGIVASDMPGTVVRKLLAAFHKVTGTPNTDGIDQAEKGGA